MNNSTSVLLALALSLAMPDFGSAKDQTRGASASLVPRYDHIVIVIEENKDYNEVVGSRHAPYINNVLVKEGANLTRMFAEEHFSEGNYFWLFCGSNHNIGFTDQIPSSHNNPVYPFQADNLGRQMIQAGFTFKGYCEGLPKIGDTVSAVGNYARKHVPWVSFGNLPSGSAESTSVNLQFLQFPSDYSALPTLCIVIPDLINDMHSGPENTRVASGDAWLGEKMNGYYQWAKSHNSLLIVTFDENNDRILYKGLTDPASKKPEIQNRIPTIIAGAGVKHGDFPEGAGVTHVNLLRTIEAMYGLPAIGKQQGNAARFGIRDDYVIKDIFQGTN
jgi:phosphatidylinositol-3-phosphatase